MKSSHLLMASLAVTLPATVPVFAASTTSTLTAVAEPGFNEITLEFSPPFLPTGTGTTKLSGTVEVDLEIDPDTGQVSEMTIVDGSVTGTPLTLSGSSFAGNYNLTSSALGASLATPLPPGTVNPATGEFDAAQHTFTVNSGTLGGNISVPLAGINETIAFDFADTPVGGAGSGTGSITLTPTGSTPTSKSYQVVVLLPIDVSEVFVVDGPVGPIEIPISATGTAKLVGPATIELIPDDPFIAWSEANGIAGALFEGDENGDGVPNGLVWGLGLAIADSPFPHLLQPAGSVGPAVAFRIDFPASGSAADIAVLVSDDPESTPFALLDTGSVSSGNPIPAGTSGSVTINLPNNGASQFVRLGVDAPGD